MRCVSDPEPLIQLTLGAVTGLTLGRMTPLRIEPLCVWLKIQKSITELAW